MTSEAIAPAGLLAQRVLRQHQGGTTILTRHSGGSTSGSIILEKFAGGNPSNVDFVWAVGQNEVTLIEAKPIDYPIHPPHPHLSGRTITNATSNLLLIAPDIFMQTAGMSPTNATGSTATNTSSYITKTWDYTLAHVPLPAFALGVTDPRASAVGHTLGTLGTVGPQTSGGPAEWLVSALDELDTSVVEAAEEELQVPSAEVISYAKEIIELCSLLNAPEPVADFDETGGIEIFFKRGVAGLLFVVAPTGILQVFGHVEGDKWRARYQLGGRSWRRHLPTLLADVG